MQTSHVTKVSSTLGTSHRTVPEQLVGGFILCFTSFLFCLLNGWLSLGSSFSFSSWTGLPCWAAYHFTLPFAMWILWRTTSLLSLKLELTLFFSQFLLQTLFFICFCTFQMPLFSFYLSVFWVSSTILSILLFRKKKNVSGMLLIPAFLWTLTIMGWNMALCILNP